MNRLIPHIQRLKRHYEHSVKTYDEISLLDLSHTLRMWVDLKPTLPSIDTKFKSTCSFKTGSPSRKLLKIVASSEYVFCYMPDKTVTYASKGEVFLYPNIQSQNEATCGVKVTRLSNGIEMSHFSYTSKALDETGRKALEHGRVTRCNYASWLASEAIRYRFKDKNDKLINTSISREILIKRLANTMNGSHPSITNNPSNNNKFDNHIEYLMQFKWGGLPLPYFVLLQTAQVILAKISVSGINNN